MPLGRWFVNKLAVIPARAGSTRLKNKNIYPLGGKPLIRWVTEAVVNSGCFDKILVSTDGDKIFDAVKDLPVERHVRPASLATTKSTVLNAMLDLIEHSNVEYDVFSYFLPTCPFINCQDIQNGIRRIDKSDFVISMTEFSETIQLACLINNSNVIPVFDNLEIGATNSKFIKKYYKPSGAFYIGKWDKILEYKNFFSGNVQAVIVPKERSIDINNHYDLLYAESVLKLR